MKMSAYLNKLQNNVHVFLIFHVWCLLHDTVNAKGFLKVLQGFFCWPVCETLVGLSSKTFEGKPL